MEADPKRALNFSQPTHHQPPPLNSQLTFTIASEKPTVADARADGADKLAAVQAALERAAAGAPVKTSFLSVQPVTTRPKEGEAPKTTAYSFRAGLTATLKSDGGAPTDLAAAAASAVDAALAAGGDSTSVSGIQFRLSRAAAAKQATEARKLAAVDATTTARETAAALNLKLGAPRSIVVGRDGGGSNNFVPFTAAAAAKAADGAAAAPTPLKVTDAETTASVEIVFGACEA